MYSIVADNIDELYLDCLDIIIARGNLTHPRGFDCKEISPCSVTLTNPQNNILLNPIRKASKAFMGAELLWILMGRNDVDMISFYNAKIKEFSDNSVYFFGAYGPKVINQLPYIVQILQKDPWSRQAIINIWRENPPQTKDVPCTVTFHFIRRPLDALNLVVYMRSQDIWLGFPYDVHNFTCIQLIVASILGCKPGTFTLVQGSLHMYEQDFEKAKKAIKENLIGIQPERTPMPLPQKLEEFNYSIELLKIQEEKYRKNTAAGPYIIENLLQQKMDWLYNFARRKHEAGNH